jgi:hypothetical protein
MSQIYLKGCNMSTIIPLPDWGSPTQPQPDWYEDDEDDYDE